MTNIKQSQKSGNSSINVQAENINIQNLSYEDIKGISMDVFELNFYRLSEIAANTAKERAEEFIDNFLDVLKERNPEGLQHAENPDLQYSLFIAQKEYARTGDKELGDILVDIIVDRTKEADRSILQIVLNESLRIAPKLTRDQLSTLSVIFSLRYTKYLAMNDLSSLNHYFNRISSFVEDITVNPSCYRHLEYTGCASINMLGKSIEQLFREIYPGLFSKGFTESEKKDINLDNPSAESIFIPCLHNPQLFQIGLIDNDLIKKYSAKNNLNDETTNKLIELQNNHLMSEEDVKDYLKVTHPGMDKLFNVWDNSNIKNMTLTSVGIAIGHANTRRITRETESLSIWIN